MLTNAEKVKRWRNNTKQKIVEAMGGSCQICGYNRCLAGLAFHHKDPKEKDFSLGRSRANPKSWQLITQELRKCVLLCHLCHTELHENLIILPKNVAEFNEEFANFKTKIEQTDECIVCKTLKPKHQKTCSRNCSAKLSRKIDWDSIDLEKIIKIKSITKIAEELNCSDAAVHKRLKKLNLK